ncbi:MAG: virulence-associated protein VapB [Pseudomonadota bacterium]
MAHVSEKTAPYAADTPPRNVRLFRNGANQAVRIPREFEFPGTEALMRKVGNTLVIEPIAVEYPRGSPQAFLQALDEIAALGPCEDEFPDVDAGLLPLDDIVL